MTYNTMDDTKMKTIVNLHYTDNLTMSNTNPTKTGRDVTYWGVGRLVGSASLAVPVVLLVLM